MSLAEREPSAMDPACQPRKRIKSKTICPTSRYSEIFREELKKDPALAKIFQDLDIIRPRKRSECRNGVRPCPFVGCKHHLYLDVNPKNGHIKFNFPDAEVWELEETCALDVAERERGITLEEVGRLMNLTRERTRQVEVGSLMKVGGSLEDGNPSDSQEQPQE